MLFVLKSALSGYCVKATKCLNIQQINQLYKFNVVDLEVHSESMPITNLFRMNYDFLYKPSDVMSYINLHMFVSWNIKNLHFQYSIYIIHVVRIHHVDAYNSRSICGWTRRVYSHTSHYILYIVLPLQWIWGCDIENLGDGGVRAILNCARNIQIYKSEVDDFMRFGLFRIFTEYTSKICWSIEKPHIAKPTHMKYEKKLRPNL